MVNNQKEKHSKNVRFDGVRRLGHLKELVSIYTCTTYIQMARGKSERGYDQETRNNF